MSSVIHKYLLDAKLIGGGLVEMPAGAEILHVSEQHGNPWVWARVNLGAAMVQRRIAIALTGKTYDFYGNYIGTFFLDHGSFVGHVFDAGETS